MEFIEAQELKQAKTRVWGIWGSHLLLAPVASVVYASKTNNWLPTIVATGIALVGLPLAVIDLGITSGIIAPVTSAGMLSAKVMEARRKRGILDPIQAEADYFNGLMKK